MSAGISPSPTQAPSVLIADDNPAMLQTAARVLSPQFNVVSTVKDGGQALDLAARANPDLIVLDIHMPRTNGFEAARKLAERKSSGKIVFLTAQEDDDYVSEALNLGARGYVLKHRLHSDLIPALKFALNDQFFISPHAFSGTPNSEPTRHVLQFYRDHASFFGEVADFTYAALRNNELVFTFLDRPGILFIGYHLHKLGLDYAAAIARGQFWVFNVESMLSLLVGHDLPNVQNFDAVFRACLKRAVAHSEHVRKLTIFSDVIGTILRQGHGYELAAGIDALWNEMIPAHSCTVYCGCPLERLGDGASRQALSRICCDHGDVTLNRN